LSLKNCSISASSEVSESPTTVAARISAEKLIASRQHSSARTGWKITSNPHIAGASSLLITTKCGTPPIAIYWSRAPIRRFCTTIVRLHGAAHGWPTTPRPVAAHLADTPNKVEFHRVGQAATIQVPTSRTHQSSSSGSIVFCHCQRQPTNVDRVLHERQHALKPQRRYSLHQSFRSAACMWESSMHHTAAHSRTTLLPPANATSGGMDRSYALFNGLNRSGSVTSAHAGAIGERVKRTGTAGPRLCRMPAPTRNRSNALSIYQQRRCNKSRGQIRVNQIY
jgi:hypothetical protein